MTTSRLALTTLFAAMIASAASAEPWRCTFTEECQPGGVCHSASFQARVSVAASGLPTLSTVTGTSPLTRLTPEGPLPASYGGAALDGVAELLTIEADQSAILTLHIFDAAPAAITYFGTCEGLS